MKKRELPERCPQCGRVTSWSPKRVWCALCGFTMRAHEGEGEVALVARWNAAIRYGDGFADLVRENGARDAEKKINGGVGV